MKPSNKPRPSPKPSKRPAPGQLRIVGGQFKRTPLPIAAVEGLRPTPERLRETLFNWLGADLSGWRCLDVFAGTGALGFEAASRGAAWVLLNELNPQAHAQLQKNAALLQSRQGAEGLRLQVQRQDALAWLQKPPLDAAQTGADVVFLDPPFAQSHLYEASLGLLRPWLRPHAFVYLEADAAWPAERLAGLGWQLLKHSRVGAVHGHLLQVLGG